MTYIFTSYTQTATTKQNKTIVYTDQTWVNAHYTNKYIWVDYDGKGGWKVPSGKGQRLIVV